jgi:hypothetical protein
MTIRILIISVSAIVSLTSFVSAQPNSSNVFLKKLQVRFSKPVICMSSACICSISDEPVALRLISEYGAMFSAVDKVQLPNRCIFENEMQVTEFHRGAKSSVETIGGVTIELQDAAMTALISVQTEAAKKGLRISPLDGSIAGKRSYSDTIRIWNSRYLKALFHWVRRGKVSPEEAEIARQDKVLTQIRKVMDWENNGLNFGTNIKGSIFSSTAPPGTSQHLSMLAFDVVQYSNRSVRAIMNKHGWFQTVANDPPHFTFLGLTEKELPSRGLKNIVRGNYKFWVPDLK